MAALAASVLCGCISDHRSFVVDTAGGWSGPVTVVVPNADTVSLLDIRIAVRYDVSFGGGEIPVAVRTERPDSVWFEEPFVLRLQRDGRSVSALHDASCPYRLRSRLDRAGDYRITLTPSRPVEGVSAVGIDIVKSEE